MRVCVYAAAPHWADTLCDSIHIHGTSSGVAIIKFECTSSQFAHQWMEAKKKRKKQK